MRNMTHRTWILALSLPLLAACDIQEILEVDIPGRVEESALENPKLASTLTKTSPHPGIST